MTHPTPTPAANVPARVPFDVWYAAHRDPVDAAADAAAELRAKAGGAVLDAAGLIAVAAPAVWLLSPVGDAATAGIAGYIVLSHLVRLGEAVGLLRRRRADLADSRAGAVYAHSTPTPPDPADVPWPAPPVPAPPAKPAVPVVPSHRARPDREVTP